MALAAGVAIPLALLASPASAQVLRRDGTLYYPPGVEVSRALTPIEREYLRRHPFQGGAADAVTPPPSGPIHCAAEYEPMEAIMVAWVGVHTGIIGQLGRWTTTTGNAEFHVMLNSAGSQSTANSTLVSAGANMSRVRYFVPTASLNTVWIRDYGPRYIYEGGCRGIIDHKYNRPRPADDVLPDYYGLQRRHAFYQLGLNGNQLIHGGGNYHLDAVNRGYATRLIVNENLGSPNFFTEPQVVSIWETYQGLQQTLFTPFPTSVDATQHLDMWMQVIADNKVVISDWPNNPGSTQDQICDSAAVFMAGRGYTVYRIPAFSIGSHFTFTNMVMCNDVVMVPSYSHSTVSPHNAAVVATLQAALPGKTIQQINCDSIIGQAGAIHCIVMHVPKHRGAPGAGGGLAPTAFVKAPVGGGAVPAGAPYQVRWISDDDVLVTSVDVEYSLNGGATWVPLAMWAPDTGAYTWNTPAVHANRARLRVTAWDAQGNAGSDESGSFRLGNPCYANCDDSTTAPALNVADFSCFLTAYASGDGYANCDSSTTAPILNVADFSCFLQSYAGGCP
ncbi:MAG: agmatine deiminase family protein [Phycisphaerales bacterium]